MDKNPFFSIIMPVYSVEKYIEDCVKSITNQDFADFELILVDDCTPDNSGAICDELAKSDARIRVFHLPENVGANNARTVGLNNARGEYVTFMDSDDTVEAGVFKRVYDEIQKNHPQIVMFGAREKYYNKNNELYRTVEITYPEKFLSTKQQVREEVIEIEKTTLFGYMWNKFYSMNLVRESGVKFVDMKLNEDFKFNIDIIQNAETFSCMDFVGYNYFKREDISLTSRFVPNYFELQQMRVMELRNSYASWDLYTDEIKKALGNIYARSTVSALQRNCDKRSKMSHKDRKKWLNNLQNDFLWNELSTYIAAGISLQGILNAVLKTKNKILCLCAGRFIFIVKEKLPSLFTRVK